LNLPVYRTNTKTATGYKKQQPGTTGDLKLFSLFLHFVFQQDVVLIPDDDNNK
jgi:hypothetical protein